MQAGADKHDTQPDASNYYQEESSMSGGYDNICIAAAMSDIDTIDILTLTRLGTKMKRQYNKATVEGKESRRCCFRFRSNEGHDG